MELPAFWSLDTELTAEHRALDHILGDVEFLTERRSFVQAAKRFAEFRYRMEEHLLVEERVLLPLYLQTHAREEEVARIRAEHAMIRDALGAVAQAISSWDVPAFVRRVSALTARLASHHLLEEETWHPALAQTIRTRADWMRLCSSTRPTAQL